MKKSNSYDQFAFCTDVQSISNMQINSFSIIDARRFRENNTSWK